MKNILWLTRVHPWVGRRKEFNFIPRKIKTKNTRLWVYEGDIYGDALASLIFLIGLLPESLFGQNCQMPISGKLISILPFFPN